MVKAYLTRQERLGAFPFEIAIGITNRCNLNCGFCPRSSSGRPIGEISAGLLDSLLDQVAPYVNAVDLSFDGEPFLHSRWADCVEACHRRRIQATLQTNGLLVNDRLAREILDVGVDSITFSIDAATADTYRLLKPGGDFQLLTANVENFLRLARSRKKRPTITLQFVRGPGNRHEVKAFLRQWDRRGADFLRIKPMLNFGGSVDSGSAAEPRKPCILLWTSLSIHWDGIVTLCCMDIEGRTVMGDAKKTPLMEIADSEPFRQARRLQFRGEYAKHPVCRNCDVPSVAWPFVIGSIFIDDMERRQLIRFFQKFGFLQR
ncbi:MAG: radical SAM protein [Candidatus Erginobacter occultus]|nr:radical SAM protein [Candidatus Erginobacter occultus]